MTKKVIFLRDLNGFNNKRCQYLDKASFENIKNRIPVFVSLLTFVWMIPTAVSYLCVVSKSKWRTASKETNLTINATETKE